MQHMLINLISFKERQDNPAFQPQLHTAQKSLKFKLYDDTLNLPDNSVSNEKTLLTSQ